MSSDEGSGEADGDVAENGGGTWHDTENGVRHRAAGADGPDTVQVSLGDRWNSGPVPSLEVAGQQARDLPRAHGYSEKRRDRKGSALWAKGVMLVVRALHAVRLVPNYWLDSGGESGHSEPHVIVWIRSGALMRRLLPLAFACIIAGALLYCVITFAASSAPTLVHNGHVIDNPYNPVNPAVVDFDSRVAQQWMSRRPASMGRRDVDRGFFTAPIYSTRRDMNVTLAWLRNMLQDVCEKTECDCVSAAEVGVWVRAIYADGELMLSPRIIAQDGAKHPVMFEDGVERQLPAAASFEYMCTTGQQHDRKTLTWNANFCVMHAMAVLSERGNV
jgi:hypothetical protein